MRMTHASMYARLLASDASCNGRFFTGVLTTGIYCLPACRARKPRPENVKFFPTCEAARAAGLRPCKKCHPDDFARGADPVRQDVETLVGEIRRDPGAFADARAVVLRSGFGTTRLFELFRQHFQTTPADLLIRARLAAAKAKLLSTNLGLLEIGQAVGFDSASAFHDHFRRCNGLTPGGYRELRQAETCVIQLPDGYSIPYLRRALGRDPHSLTERLEGERYTLAARFASGPALLRLQLDLRGITAEFDPGNGPEAHGILVGLLGLDQDALAFVRLARRLGMARLVAKREHLRLAQTPSVYEALLWSIVGQQINFPFACLLRRRLVELVSEPLAAGLYEPPSPAAIAALEPAELLPLQFSRQKAEYLISISREVAEGRLDLGALRTMSATRAEQTLLAQRGLGPWSVNYLLMRALGFADCVPLGDTGVTSGLQAVLKLETRPDLDATRRLMAMFTPYRSLATAHLWQFGHPLPS